MYVLDLTRDVRIVDPFAHSDLDKALMVRELLNTFAYELGRPIRTSDSEVDYVPTQFVSEYFRCKGFAGILFPTVAKGFNAVFFDPAVGTVDRCTQVAVWSKSVDVVSENLFDAHCRSRRGCSY